MESSDSRKSKWAAYFGGVTVIASLLLVAWEIRQNTVALTAQSLQDLNAMANEILLTAAESGELSAVLVKGDEDLASLTDTERAQYWAYNYGVINAMDAAFGFYQKGILDEADYSGWRTYTCDYLGKPSLQTIWDEDRATFGTEFSAYVEAECGF